MNENLDVVVIYILYKNNAYLEHEHSLDCIAKTGCSVAGRDPLVFNCANDT